MLKSTVHVSKSYKEDISTLPKDPKTCATYVYRTDDKAGPNGWHWVLITFVPDHAAVSCAHLSLKMLTSSEQQVTHGVVPFKTLRSEPKCCMLLAKEACSNLLEKVVSSKTCSLRLR